MSWPVSILGGLAVLIIALAARLLVRASNGTLVWTDEQPLWAATLIVTVSALLVIALGPEGQAVLPPLIVFATSLVLATQRLPARDPAITHRIRLAGLLGLVAGTAWLLQVAVNRLS
jgi:hypothetical protein